MLIKVNLLTIFQNIGKLVLMLPNDIQQE